MARRTTKTSAAKKATSPMATRRTEKAAAKKAVVKAGRYRKDASQKLKKQALKRGGTVDFSDVTHELTEGVYKSFRGIRLGDGAADGRVTVRLIQNPRGRRMKESRTLDVDESNISALTSYHMIETIDVGGDEAEDRALLAYEGGTWECRKCRKANGNDSGYCNNVVDGKLCGGTKKCEMKTWAGCFAVKETWQCKFCALKNEDMDADKCAACESGRYEVP